MVDFPLSTFPTTAHRTSGVEATSGGGNRKSSAALGESALVSNNIDVFRAMGHSKSFEKVGHRMDTPFPQPRPRASSFPG